MQDLFRGTLDWGNLRPGAVEQPCQTQSFIKWVQCCVAPCFGFCFGRWSSGVGKLTQERALAGFLKAR